MKKAVLPVMLAIVTVLAAYCGYRYYNDAVLPEKKLAEADEAQLRLFEDIKPDIPENTQEDSSPDNDRNLLAAAEKVNPGVVGWLTIPGTHIDYPVAQGVDNDFYLHNGFDGNYNQELGCPFLDYRCEGGFSGFNSIVYAHHMTEQRMFADIALFKDENFFDSHSDGCLITPDGVHTVQFFAYLNVPDNAPAYHAVFVTDKERQEYIDYLYDAAMFTRLNAADIHTDMHLLLLSTCTFEYEEARGVLVGVIQ